MHALFLTTIFVATCLVVIVADAVVEIEKQKLIKFPDDQDQQQRRDENQNNDKQADEAKRILQEIEKINQALGYVRKQPEQSRLPPILDSSQYLFPKPAYSPFHAQHHQFAGSNGQTFLEPSIRAVNLERGSNQLAAYNVPPQLRRPLSEAPQQQQQQQQQEQLTVTRNQPQFFYRPNEVHVPAPQTPSEAQQLPTHFVIPVRLYKLNKTEYIRQQAPEQFRVKGYKIVGDIDSFYGKAKAKGSKQGKSTPKYHLFFLPRELALNAPKKHAKGKLDKMQKQNREETTSELTEGSASRELLNRPFKVQASANSNLNSNNLGASQNTSSNAQVTRKRVVPKLPLRKKETIVNAAAEQTLSNSGGNVAAASSTIKQTPTPVALNTHSNAAAEQQLGAFSNNNNYNNNNYNNNPNTNLNNNNNVAPAPLPTRNRLNPFRITDMAELQNTTSTAIKNAFQNIFKFPSFRPDHNANEQVLLQSVPLQAPNPAIQPPSPAVLPTYAVVSSPNKNPDYKWDDDDDDDSDNDDYVLSDASNSAAEVVDPQSAEKHIFGHKTQQHHAQTLQTVANVGAQKEALREGGIIIQRLKVRKGGIAIAGPGGVATAGSGGTAIVGPGGYALTHPRSLTIAGPGAKVIALPANVDLKEALKQTNLQEKSFPREGKVVAIGPTVYYAPPTGLSAEVEEQTHRWQTAQLETWPPAFPAISAKLLQQQTQEIARTPLQPIAFASAYNGLLPGAAQYFTYQIQQPYYTAAAHTSLHTVAHPVLATTTTTSLAETTTAKVRDVEPTTERARANGNDAEATSTEALQKLQATPLNANTVASGDFVTDTRLRAAVAKINPDYVIEEILPIPGKHVLSTSSTSSTSRVEKFKQTSAKQKKVQLRAEKLSAAKLKQPKRTVNSPVKVEATGITRTQGTIPQIPFGTYFLPYYAQAVQQQPELKRKQAALILEPHSKAIVGNGGTAISTPISRALLKKGVPTNVYFNPESVAIAGVGGKAHAQADLELDLHRSIGTPIIFEEPLLYYGGLQGPVVSQQQRDQRGHHANSFLLTKTTPEAAAAAASSATAVASTRETLIAGADDDDSVTVAAAPAFPQDFNKIQIAAARLVAIQELAKRKGAFSAEDNQVYANSLLELGQAAQNLALLQRTGQIKDFSVLLQPEAFMMPQRQPPFGLVMDMRDTMPTSDQKIDEQKMEEVVTEQQLTPEDLLPPNNENPYEDVDDSVAVMAPKKDASVAEAKPVGLSIAGEGGVASSKPNAIALSGRNGLAVASPKATAIAGVTPEEAAAFSISLPSRNQLVIKTPNSAAEKSGNEDYDYAEMPPTLLRPQAHTNAPHGRPPVRFVSTSFNAANDALITKWRTAIAEDYAAKRNMPVQAPSTATRYVQSKPQHQTAVPQLHRPYLHYL